MKYNKQNFTVDETNDYIVLTMNKTKTVDYFTNNQIFLGILKHYKPSLEIDKQQRIRAVFYLPNRERHDQKYFLYDIAYACYANKVCTDSFLDDMCNFIKWKNNNRYTTDHADSNHRNNTVFNLSMMTRKLNSSKSDLIARFVDPFSIITAYCNGEYRIDLHTRVNIETIENLTLNISGFGTLVPHPIGESTVKFICKDANSYIACLRWLYDTRVQWCNGQNTPRMIHQKNSGYSYWSGNIKNSLKGQKILVQSDSSKFNVFEMEYTRNQL